MSLKFMILIIISIIFLFQNCSKVDLESLPSIQSASLAKPEGSICAPEGVSFTAPMRFVFIIDMSMSNIGTLKTTTIDNVTTYSLDTSDGPSDIKGERFSQVRSFIEKCGNSSDSKYAIIGFSESAMLENNQSCFNEFEDKSNAIKSIDSLKGKQLHDLGITRREKQNPYYLQGQTFYSAGLSCAKNKIFSELSQLTQDKPIYKIFFITDGMTTDSAANQNYKQTLNEIKSQATTKAAGISFFPVFYTSAGAKNQGEQVVSAQALMDQMAQEVDPSQKTILLSDIASSEVNLCQYIKPSIPVKYELYQSYAVNVSSLMKKNIHYGDSDADGLSDEDELRSGFNPTNSHSGIFHDSLCARLGLNLAQCNEHNDNLVCDKQKVNFFGLTECDEQLSMKIFGKKMSDLDSDKDSIPDWLELIRSMNPLKVDTFDIPFNDGLFNFQKISKGIDVLSNVKIYPVNTESTIDVRLSENSASCENEVKRYDYQFHRIPFSDNLSYVDSNPNLNLTHKENENIVLFFSYWKAIGGVSLPTKIYLQKIIVQKNQPNYQIDNYRYLGEL